MLNQFGCVLVVSSVIDTFLVRAIFVPALMFLGGDKFIWWPGSPPVPHISINPEGELVEEKDGFCIEEDGVEVLVTASFSHKKPEAERSLFE